MDETLKENISARSTWLRALFIILFALIYSVAEIVIGAVVILQFLFVLFSGNANGRLLEFGQSLSTYVFQILQYVTFNSEQRPFPFSDWPKPRDEEDTAELSHGSS